MDDLKKKLGDYQNQLREKFHKILEEENNFLADSSLHNIKRPSLFAHGILWGTLLFFAIAILWASFAKIDEFTIGEGKVIPSSKVQVIQNLEGGIVSDILVRQGSVVEKNQILMHIDDTRFSTSFEEGRLKELAVTAKIARLSAEATDKPLVLPSDKRFQTHLAFLRNEEALYKTRQHEKETKLETLSKEKQQKAEELSALKARLVQLEKSYELVNRELDMTRPLVKSGAVSEVEVLRLERQANDITGDIATTRFGIPKAESSIAEVNSKIAQVHANFRSEAQKELNAAKAELETLKQSNIALADRFDRTAVRSPVKGTVKNINVATIGGVVQPGMELMQIVPLDDTLLIEARIRPSDIGFLRPGQKAIVKITAYDFSIYGGLDAELEHISADTIKDEKGDSYYEIYVRTNKNYLGTSEKPLLIIPGMLATVDILTGEKTVMQYLLKPLIKAKQGALRER